MAQPPAKKSKVSKPPVKIEKAKEETKEPLKGGSAIRQGIINFMKQHGDVGITEIVQCFPPSSEQEVAQELNWLIQDENIEAMEDMATKKPIFRLTDPRIVQQLKGCTDEEKTVYKFICRAGEKGGWSKMLAKQLDMPTAKFTKLAKKLIDKELVRQNKLPGSTKKSYMAAYLAPPSDPTSHQWDNKENEGDLLKLSKFIETHLSTAGSISVSELLGAVTTSRLVSWLLTAEDLQLIVDGMVHQGCLMKRWVDDGFLYSVVENKQSDYSTIPCFACPVASACHEGAPVNPQECVYLTKWLQGEKLFEI